ncbi:hypothetical protein D3Y57_14210 [Sphingomonas paeninsulae]|jgi:O-antigen ligase|uniref:Uncharacterized protein n=2 Tax=Sphingomonas paeninsulae TaxID=2319844 RepID=A0A494TIR7_SPHPE|nr:hypothetical protein D3Y57_14210 [Sphingomonas paeninsulae]
MPRSSHILNAASNLLGISLLIIAGLKIANAAQKTLADEIAWGATLLFALSCLLSYISLRTDSPKHKMATWADRAFLTGLLVLISAVLVLAFTAI